MATTIDTRATLTLCEALVTRIEAAREIREYLAQARAEAEVLTRLSRPFRLHSVKGA